MKSKPNPKPYSDQTQPEFHSGQMSSGFICAAPCLGLPGHNLYSGWAYMTRFTPGCSSMAAPESNNDFYVQLQHPQSHTPTFVIFVMLLKQDVCLQQVNGEIYNHENLRKLLSNHKFRTGSDCEVIAHLVSFNLSVLGFIGFYSSSLLYATLRFIKKTKKVGD